MVTDAEGTVLYVSASIQHMLGHDAESLLGADGWSAVHPDDRAVARDMVTRVAAGWEAPRSCRCGRAMRPGPGGTVEATASNLLDTAVGGIVCNLVDVTERVEAERALRASEARYRAIADTGGEGIWAISAQGTTLYVNARMAEILGVLQQRVYDGDVAAFVGAEAGGTTAAAGCPSAWPSGSYARRWPTPPRRRAASAVRRGDAAAGHDGAAGACWPWSPTSRTHAGDRGAADLVVARQPDRPAEPDAAAGPAAARARAHRPLPRGPVRRPRRVRARQRLARPRRR